MTNGCQRHPADVSLNRNRLTEYDLGLKYILDTITIKEPRIAVNNDNIFIVAGKYVEEFADNPHKQEGKLIFQIPPMIVRQDLCGISPVNSTEFSCRAMNTQSLEQFLFDTDYSTKNVIFDKRIGNVDYYRFRFPPRRFLLELMWYNPHRYTDSFPFGPDISIIMSTQSIDSITYCDKLDSLERNVPSFPLAEESPHYILTVEPLFSRDVVNEYIEWDKDLIAPLYPKRFYTKDAFPDFG